MNSELCPHCGCLGHFCHTASDLMLCHRYRHGPPAFAQSTHLEFFKIDEAADLPTQQTRGSAGYDLTCLHHVALEPGQITMVSTGVGVKIPYGSVGLLTIRSSFAMKQLCLLANAPGIIDSDYRGEIKCLIFNASQGNAYLIPHERIAQLIIVKCSHAPSMWGETDETERGEGGFGSTGK